ncbi:MAG: BPSL0067 family protein [Alphaproteobacteria bacterium]|nr:BPSL0067 family protein [Alphaproteobacteria bacterium]
MSRSLPLSLLDPALAGNDWFDLSGPDAISDLVDRPGKEPPNVRLLAAASTGADDANPDADGAPKTAQAEPQPIGPDKAAIRADIDEFARSAIGKQYVGDNSECVSLVKKAIPTLGATPGWRAGEAIKAPNDPPLRPGTAVATFLPDPKTGEPRYRSEPTGNHAGIFLSYGEQGGRSGMFLLDQSRNVPVRESFFPFERSPGERGYTSGQFSVIRPRGAK